MKSKLPVIIASMLIVASVAFQTRCQAMLVAPKSDSEAVDVIHEAVTRRLASRVSVESIELAKEADCTARATVLNSVKRAAPDVPLPTEAELNGGYSLSQYAAFLGVAALPFAAVLGLWWLTRNALASRDRERRATLRMLRLVDPDEKPKPSRKSRALTPTMPLEQFLALRAKFGQPIAETPLP